jgi:hypothetical protein
MSDERGMHVSKSLVTTLYSPFGSWERILLGYEKNTCGPHSKRNERSFPENNIYVGLS